MENGKLPPEGNVFFKFEPFVLHVCCRTLDRAREMVSMLMHALHTWLVVEHVSVLPVDVWRTRISLLTST